MFRQQPRHEPTPVTDRSATAPAEPVVAIDDGTFLDQTAGRVTLVDFWAPWCGPCRTFTPIFEAAAEDHSGRVAFATCNVDTSPRTAALLHIQSIPTGGVRPRRQRVDSRRRCDPPRGT